METRRRVEFPILLSTRAELSRWTVSFQPLAEGIRMKIRGKKTTGKRFKVFWFIVSPDTFELLTVNCSLLIIDCPLSYSSLVLISVGADIGVGSVGFHFSRPDRSLLRIEYHSLHLTFGQFQAQDGGLNIVGLKTWRW